MKVLVTGATGFLGGHVVEALRQRGHTVRALHRPATTPDFPDDVELARLDLRSPEGSADALADIDVVVHAAAVKAGDLHEQFAGTVTATDNLLTAMAAAGVRRIVLVSSFAVYDDARMSAGELLHEGSPTGDPAAVPDAYAATKLLQEELVAETAAAAGWSATIARPGVIYGPDNLWTVRLGYRSGQRAWFCVGSRARLPLTHVDNAADALAHLAELTEPGIRTVNVVDDDPPTQRQYRRQLIEVIGRPRRLVVIPWFAVHLAARLLDRTNALLGGPLKLPGALRLDAVVTRWRPANYTNRALHALGWRQPVPWPETLARSVEPPAYDRGAEDDRSRRHIAAGPSTR